MTDPFELKRAAIRLRDQYRALNDIKMTPPKTPLARKTKPTFGPQSPNPDGDWALNIEHLLVNECDDDNPNAEAPSGLFNMVVDAQRYIHNRTIQTRDGHRLANFIALHSGAIAHQFPAADDLLELIIEQAVYISRHIEKLHGARNLTPMPPDTMATGYGTAADIAPLVSAVLGHHIDRDKIRYWGRSGRITTYTTPSGTTHYQLAEVIEQARNYVDKRVSK